MQKNNSPWIAEIIEYVKEKEAFGEHSSDICVIGGGIAGMTNAYTILTGTNNSVILLEAGKIAHGATGHNAGYVVADFEKPFTEIIKEFGIEKAEKGIEEVESAWEYLFEICEKINFTKPKTFSSFGGYTYLEKFLDDVEENQNSENFFLKQNSKWINQIPENILEKIKIISEKEFCKILNISKEKAEIYEGIISEKAAVLNSALFTTHLAHFLLQKYQNRFSIYQNSAVERIHILNEKKILIDTKNAQINSEKVILCTNGFENFTIYDTLGKNINSKFHKNVSGVIGYMLGTLTSKKLDIAAGFLHSEFKENKKTHIKEADPYTYFSKRKFIPAIKENYFKNEGNSIGIKTLLKLLGLEKKKQLFCIGGPEISLKERMLYTDDHKADEKVYKELEEFQKSFFAINEKPIFYWHGLMGYTESGIRTVGKDPNYENLFYNLGCNGIGILPSIAGSFRIAKIINNEILEESIFDPK